MPPRVASSNVRSADVSSKPVSAPPTPAQEGDDAAGRGLRRGLNVLEAVLRAGRVGLRVVDLCRECALERATVYRVLETLALGGYVARRDRFRYVAGPRALALGALASAPWPSDLAARLQPVLARISTGCGDASFAVVREGPLSVCIARQVGSFPVQILSVQIGLRQPLGVGAAGLALLASLPPDESAAMIGINAPALGAYGDMTPERLRILVKATRERGWSVVGNHAVKGALGVGMAVLGADRTPLAAISVAAAMGRMTRDRQRLIAALIRDALTALLPKRL